MHLIIVMNSGAYQLIIFIEKYIELEIGALGLGKFTSGYYIYTGSAMKNLQQRVSRHYSENKKIKWHIDYLLNNNYVKLSGHKLYQTTEKIECELNSELIYNPNYSIPMKGFGASDCNKCASHLVYLGNELPEVYSL